MNEQKLAKDQTLPLNPALRNTPYDWRAGYNQAQLDMVAAGWRKVNPKEKGR